MLTFLGFTPTEAVDFFVSVSAVCSLYSIRRLYYPASFIVRPASSEFPSTLPSSEQIYSSRRFFSSPFCLAHSLKTARRPRVYIYIYIYIYIYATGIFIIPQMHGLSIGRCVHSGNTTSHMEYLPFLRCARESYIYLGISVISRY